VTTQEILSRLKCVRRTAKGWMARCPAHQDRSPSLSAREAEGRILLHCFAGCRVEAICSAIEVRLSDLFTERGERRKAVPRIVRDAERDLARGGLRSRLTTSDRERPVTVVLADRTNPDSAIARALALTVEGELVQVAFAPETESR